MSSKNKIRVAVSGYFDPIHVGHLEYLKMAKELGDSLVVIVNNNYQCKLKKTFMNLEPISHHFFYIHKLGYLKKNDIKSYCPVLLYLLKLL